MTPLQKTIRTRIIRRLRKMQHHQRETIAVKEWWNNNRLDASPFDVGFDKTLLRLIDRQLDAWIARDVEAANKWNDQMQSLVSQPSAKDI